jgi:hypothetical protein
LSPLSLFCSLLFALQVLSEALELLHQVLIVRVEALTRDKK